MGATVPAALLGALAGVAAAAGCAAGAAGAAALGAGADAPPMLASAGFAAMYRTRAWDDPDLRLALQSVRTVLAAHMPHPALALDRLYHVVEANAAATALLQRLLPQGDAGTIKEE